MTGVKNLMIVSTVFGCYFDYNAETSEITVGSLDRSQSRND